MTTHPTPRAVARVLIAAGIGVLLSACAVPSANSEASRPAEQRGSGVTVYGTVDAGISRSRK